MGTADWVRKFDNQIVDSAALGVGRFTQACSQALRTTVSGNAQHYALIMGAGVLRFFAWVMFVL